MPHTIKEARNAYSKAYYRDHKSEINARVIAINKRRRHERYAELLGVVSDKELAAKTGISRQMVAWYRRKAGITLTRQGERAA